MPVAPLPAWGLPPWPQPPALLPNAWCAANPLPWRRPVLVHLPAAAGMQHVSSGGVRVPLQATSQGSCALLTLGPGERRVLTPAPEPLNGIGIEATVRVLDNGRVRAEFDAAGRVERLCFDGDFTALAAALGGWGDAATCRVLEAGPVRARLAVEHPGGVAMWELRLHDDVLRLHGTFDPVALVGMARQPSADPQVTICGDQLRGLAVMSPTILTLGQAEGAPTAASSELRFARPRRPWQGLSLGQWARDRDEVAIDGESAPASHRLVDADDLVVVAAGELAGWRHLLFSEVGGTHARAVLYPLLLVQAQIRAEPDAAWRASTLTREGDGVVLSLQPGGMLEVRWLSAAPEHGADFHPASPGP